MKITVTKKLPIAVSSSDQTRVTVVTVRSNQGLPGAKGDKGDKGDQGDASTVPGPQGPMGPQGEQGEPGGIENATLNDLLDCSTADTVRGDFLTKGEDGVFGKNIFWDDWKWAGTAVNPPGLPMGAVLTQVATDEWHWVFSNNAVMAMPDQQVPHSYLEGSDIYPHIHFCPTVSGSYVGAWTAVFSLWLGGYGGATKQKITLTAPFNKTMTAGVEEVLPFDNVIPGLDRKISSCGTVTLKLELTSGTALAMLGFDGHYQKDRFGSNEATTK